MLLELAPRLARLENDVLAGLDPPLSIRQYRTLQRVAQGHTSLTALGRLATISLPSVSENVEGLARRGLLDRRTDPTDRRTAKLALTATGQAALHAAEAALQGLAAELTGEVVPSRQAGLVRLLSRIDGDVQRRLREGHAP